MWQWRLLPSAQIVGWAITYGAFRRDTSKIEYHGERGKNLKILPTGYMDRAVAFLMNIYVSVYKQFSDDVLVFGRVFRARAACASLSDLLLVNKLRTWYWCAWTWKFGLCVLTVFQQGAPSQTKASLRAWLYHQNLFVRFQELVLVSSKPLSPSLILNN